MTRPHHDAGMRTTVQIDDDVYTVARALAEANRLSLGAAISELARRGFAARPQPSTRSGFPVFSVRSDASPITLDVVRRALDDE